jgi:hypothetical protein
VKFGEEQRLRVFNNREMMRMFCFKRNGVTGSWRKVHSEEFHDLYYSSLNITKKIK